MSWDVVLERDGAAVQVERHTEGGTFAVGGDDTATLSVTYNYGEVFRIVWPEWAEPLLVGGALEQMLDGRTASDTIAPLAAAIEKCGGARPYDTDYWAPTPGNAKHALELLLGWARQHPDAVWRVS